MFWLYESDLVCIPAVVCLPPLLFLESSNPQSIDGDLERNDSARLWFGVLDKLVIAQKSASAAAGLITARKTELVLANVDFGMWGVTGERARGWGRYNKVLFLLTRCLSFIRYLCVQPRGCPTRSLGR